MFCFSFQNSEGAPPTFTRCMSLDLQQTGAPSSPLAHRRDVMPSLNPSKAQLEHFDEAVPSGTPVLMLNLLRFRVQADYPANDHPACSGREAYARYSRIALKKVAAAGGAVQVLAAVHAALIAPEEEQWDEIILVRYPSKEAFLGMLADPEYRAATVHRTAALVDSRLIASVERLP
jgi:uncharacterized protein (DUF1330 family)